MRTERDFFGFERLHYHPPSGVWGGSIQQVLKASGISIPSPDIAAIKGYLSGERLVGHTVLSEVRAVPPGYQLVQTASGLQVHPVPLQPKPGVLATLLHQSLQSALDSGKAVALALSGGLDSALLLALLRDMNALSQVRVYVLVTDLPNYCERDAALELAHSMQVPVQLVHASEHDFVAALPRAIAAVEEPLFNLHPVAKLLLAQAMARDGIELAITGDGADQVLRRDQSANYLPLCNALFAAASVSLHPPFLDAGVVAHLTALPPDPHKQCLRHLGASLGLPERLVVGAKHSRLAPAMNLGLLPESADTAALAQYLGLPIATSPGDAQRVLWTTLALTLKQFGLVIA